ncbi:hypothetical protein RA280_14755 [Cupriavidus sp. CV2]|uniref:hypothetical protein n=1 Tax=Cupriavidus ulmosensis TaxID=3065913 RepID=UPI00296A9CCB|nr:hypothetical protein [Cupriavidus sp. CV2]MDW3682985.1 hypothetical protein [Cupriavidus sp. CV2]
MAKPVISVDEFIAEMNNRLRRQFGYKDEWRIFLVPEGASASTASGYDWEPKTLDVTAAVAAVGEQVGAEFDVDPNIDPVAHH